MVSLAYFFYSLGKEIKSSEGKINLSEVNIKSSEGKISLSGSNIKSSEEKIKYSERKVKKRNLSKESTK